MGGSLFSPGFIPACATAETEALLSRLGTLVPTQGARGSCFPMGGSLSFHGLKSSLRGSGDRCIIVGARDFSPDSWSAGHLLPYGWLFVIPGCFGNEIQPAAGRNPANAGRNPHYVRSKSAGAARRRKSPQNFRSAGFVYPGSYLLPEPAIAGVGLGVAAQQRRRVAGQLLSWASL